MNLSKQLICGARYGSLDQVKEALTQGADINSTDEMGETALWTTVLHRHWHIADFLLDQPNIDVQRKTKHTRSGPIHHAISPDHRHIETSYEKLVARKTNTELQLCIIKKLLKKGANINEPLHDVYKDTPLHLALREQADPLIMRFLIENAQMIPEPINYVTPLQFCVSTNFFIKPSYVTMLLRSSKISFDDLLWAQKICKYHYDQQARQEKKILSQISARKEINHTTVNLELLLPRYQWTKQLLSLKGRILKSYLFTMLGLNFWPAKEGWKSMGRNIVLLDIAKLIAYQAAWYAEHTIVPKYLEFQRLPNEINFVFESESECFDLLNHCKEKLVKNGITPFTSFAEFKSKILNAHPLTNHFHIIKENNRFIGTCMLTINKANQTAQLHYLVIDPAFEHRKVGSAALKIIETIAKKENCRIIQVQCHAETASFFEKNGFKFATPINLTRNKNVLIPLEKIVLRTHEEK